MNWQTPSLEARLEREGERHGDSQKGVQSQGRGVVQCVLKMETKHAYRLMSRKHGREGFPKCGTGTPMSRDLPG